MGNQKHRNILSTIYKTIYGQAKQPNLEISRQYQFNQTYWDHLFVRRMTWHPSQFNQINPRNTIPCQQYIALGQSVEITPTLPIYMPDGKENRKGLLSLPRLVYSKSDLRPERTNLPYQPSNGKATYKIRKTNRNWRHLILRWKYDLNYGSQSQFNLIKVIYLTDPTFMTTVRLRKSLSGQNI